MKKGYLVLQDGQVFEGVRFGELFQGVEEDVDAFVAEFVAAARADDQGFAVEFAAQRRLGRADHRAACLGPFFVELPAVPRSRPRSRWG